MSDTPRTDAWYYNHRPDNYASVIRWDGVPFGAVQEGYDAVRPYCDTLEREMSAAIAERDTALRLLAEARAAAPDADPREQPIVGMVHDSRHGEYVDQPFVGRGG